MPTIQVQWRTRKKNGDWGKPKPAAFTAAETDQLPDETDRDILPLLLGASDPFALASYASVSARASFRLAGPLIDCVLPLLAQSGRLYLQRHVAPDVQPLTWDDGPPWEFSLDVSVLADGQVRVDGILAREGERIHVALPEVVLSETFLVVRGAVARFEHRGALAWMTELRAQGPTAVPAASAPALIEAMAQSSIEPSQLPEELRYEVEATTPRPRIRMARSSRPQGQGMRDELDAAVAFDYAGTIVPARPETSGYDPARRRMIRREATVERAALQRLQQLGFHRPWYFAAKAGTLAISVERFPGAVRELVAEGWHVEAEGRIFRPRSAMQMQVQSGIDWFELHGSVDFGDGQMVALPRAARRRFRHGRRDRDAG